jgi:hypothetical protein
MTRHKLPIIALVGNDAAWTQIAREQVPIFGSSVACKLAVSTCFIKDIVEKLAVNDAFVYRNKLIPYAVSAQLDVGLSYKNL